MPNYPSDFNDTVVYNGVDLYIPKDCSCTVFEDSRVFLFGEWYLNGQPILSGAAAISGAEVSVSTVQPVDPGITLWFDTSAGYGELKVKVGGSWKTVEDPQDAVDANEVQISAAQPVGAGTELWIDTSVAPENLKAKVLGSWKSINSEVAIGGVEPIDPAIELWVDTATAAPDFVQGYISPGNALGIVAIGSFLSGTFSGIAATIVNLTSTITFTPVVGRRYRIRCALRAAQVTVAGTDDCYIYLTVDGANSSDSHNILTFNKYSAIRFEQVFNGDGVTHTYKCDAVCGLAWMAYSDQASSYFYIEDLGPNTSPALPIPSTPPAWTPMVGLNGWVSNAGQTTQYRKIGDVVYVRGMLASGTVGTAMFVFPAGFRPPAIVYISTGSYVAAGGAHMEGVRLAILIDGTLIHQLGGNDSIPVNFEFSTSA